VAGMQTPILVSSSAVGNQMKAFEFFFELFDKVFSVPAEGREVDFSLERP
jgi:hypothetical protein